MVGDGSQEQSDALAQPGAVTRRTEMARAFRLGLAAAAGVLLAVVAALSLYSVRQILVLAAVALFLAVGLDPAVRALQRRGLRRGWSVAIVLLVLVAAVTALLAAVIPPLVSQATQLAQSLPGYIESARERSETLQELSERLHLNDRLGAFAATLPERAAAFILTFLQQLFGAVLSGLLVLVLAVYFLADLPRLRRGAVLLFPLRRRPRVAGIIDVVVDKVGSYIIGSLTISAIAGTVALILFLILGLPYALPLALIVAVTALIPLVGATLGAVICTVVASLSVGIWPTGVIVLAAFIAYQQLENYVIAPRVMQNAVNLPAIAVLLSGLIGATLFGLIGALMAIPTAAAVRVLLSRPTAPAGDHEAAPASQRAPAPDGNG